MNGELICPTCDVHWEKPEGRLSFWAKYLFGGAATAPLTLLAVGILTAPGWWVKSCVHGGSPRSNCLPPTEPWLALGWAGLLGLWVVVVVIINRERTRWLKRVKRYAEAVRRIEAANAGGKT